MRKLHRLGLVVGKFSPLHRGHEYLIEQAISRCEDVLVLGYSKPEFHGCDRERRQAWVARRFPRVLNVQLDDDWLSQRCNMIGAVHQPIPSNSSPDAEQQSWLGWVLGEVLKLRTDAIFASESYVVPTCALLKRLWNQDITPYLIDPERKACSISATQIREDVHAHSNWLHPDVYRDFVLRVALLGGESSGKTTLAQALAAELRTVWVPEYGRERWTEQKGDLSLKDLLEIGRIQIDREEEWLGKAKRVMFCDTSPLTTLGYAGWLFNAKPMVLQALARRSYDLIVLCHNDFSFVQDGTRQNEEFQKEQQAWYETQMTERHEPVLRVSGSVSTRVKAVVQSLSELYPQF